MDLTGKVALITGAAAGLGAGFARTLADAGADIAICDVQEEKLLDVGADIEKRNKGRRVVALRADVRDPHAVQQFVDFSAKTLGGIDIVVANAGIWRPTDPVADDADKALADWELIANTNLRGLFLTVRAAIPHLIARGGGNIVNIATDHICPPPGSATGGGTRMDVYIGAFAPDHRVEQFIRGAEVERDRNLQPLEKLFLGGDIQRRDGFWGAVDDFRALRVKRRALAGNHQHQKNRADDEAQ